MNLFKYAEILITEDTDLTTEIQQQKTVANKTS